MYYVVDKQYGEPVDSGWSMIQGEFGVFLLNLASDPGNEVTNFFHNSFSVDGFALLVIGTLIFNKILRLDWMPCAPAYPQEDVVTIEKSSDNVEDAESIDVEEPDGIKLEEF